MFNKIYAKLKEKFKLYKKEIIFLTLFALVINIRFPYYINAPGGTLSLADRIAITNGKSINGSLNLVYVLELEATIPTLLMASLNKNWDIVKQEDVIPSHESVEDVNLRGKLTLKESMSNAIVYAYQKAGKPITINEEKLYITYIHESAKTDLKIGDRIVSIANSKIKTVADITNILANYNIGDKVEVVVFEDDQEKNKYFEIIEIDNVKKVGITMAKIFDYTLEDEVEFKYSESEGGSSGGFMNTLYIYASLVEEDLIKGKKIVGTGTISEDGTIGEIGGIEYKIKAANKAKADLFFVPTGTNCEDAKKIKEEKGYGIAIECVANFDEAINYLEKN